MKSLRFLEKGKSRKAMKVMKVKRKSSYPIGTTKCMRVRRTNKIHSWAVSVGTSIIGAGSSSDAWEGTSIIEEGDTDREVGDSSRKRSGRGSIEGIMETGT